MNVEFEFLHLILKKYDFKGSFRRGSGVPQNLDPGVHNTRIRVYTKPGFGYGLLQKWDPDSI